VVASSAVKRAQDSKPKREIGAVSKRAQSEGSQRCVSRPRPKALGVGDSLPTGGLTEMTGWLVSSKRTESRSQTAPTTIPTERHQTRLTTASRPRVACYGFLCGLTCWNVIRCRIVVSTTPTRSDLFTSLKPRIVLTAKASNGILHRCPRPGAPPHPHPFGRPQFRPQKESEMGNRGSRLDRHHPSCG
jgi:hypothetical protein